MSKVVDTWDFREKKLKPKLAPRPYPAAAPRLVAPKLTREEALKLAANLETAGVIATFLRAERDPGAVSQKSLTAALDKFITLKAKADGVEYMAAFETLRRTMPDLFKLCYGGRNE